MKLKVAEEAIPIIRSAAFPSPVAGHDTGVRSGHGEPGLPEAGTPAVTVLTSAVLQAARIQRGESLDDLAARAGLTPDTIAALADGTGPVWSMPYAEFAALASSVALGDLSLRQLFETAVACDLLLTCVLVGDQAFATDVLADEATRGEARALLRLAMTGRRPERLACAGHLPLPRDLRTLGDADAVILHHRTAALAASGSPDAWVGSELASLARSAA